MMVIYCFSAVINDNDGSAFVTKAEFESLKDNFASQVDQYNTSIDSKIDGAIATYLAGVNLSKKEVLENKYNIFNPTWMKNKRFDKSHLGTKYTYFLSFTEGSHNANWFVYCYEGTATGWYVNKDLTKNSDDQEYLYRVQKKQIGKFKDQWALQDEIKADYSMTIGGGAAGGRGGSFATENCLLFPEATTFEKQDQKYFGTWFSNLPVHVWDVNNSTKQLISDRGTITGSSGTGETLAITAIAKDQPVDDHELFYLAGGSMPSETMYCLNIASVSEIGEYFATAKTNAGGTRQMWYPDWSYSGILNWTGGYYGESTEVPNPYYGNIITRIYRHVITNITSTEMLHESMTQNVGEKVYYYSGCPIFTSLANGSVTFKIKFNNTAAAKTKWALDSKAFTNAANPESCGDIDNCNVTTFESNHNQTVTVTFDVKKDTTYWIKAEPVSGYTTITFDGDIVHTGE